MLALQEIYDHVSDEGWDVTKDTDGRFRLEAPDCSATVVGPSSRSDHRAIAIMVADLRRAGLAPHVLDRIGTPEPTAPRTTDRLADARDEQRKRRQEAGAQMTTADAGYRETIAERIGRLERELDSARAEATRQESVGAAEAVLAWFQGGDDPTTDDWVAVLSAAPESAVRTAGLLVRGGPRTLGTAASSRAPRLSIDEVEARLPSVPFTVADLAARIEREPTTTRNYIAKLLEAGSIVEVGEDNSGPGRAARLYGRP